jgi:ubiquinone/menaquinone biosynthesis C-methylase UbiE
LPQKVKLKKIFRYWSRLWAKIQKVCNRKKYSALDFWRSEREVYVRWDEGEIKSLYGIPSPDDDMKVTGYSYKENVIRTWAQADIDKYPGHLLVSRDYFRGKKILDVGCGPVPYTLAFTDCEIYGLDHLVDGYARLGFPLSEYSDRLTYVNGVAEDMPFEDNFFDAVISVNAIDHVDDFTLTAKEISRILRPEGILRMEVHYHKPTVREPWELNDKFMLEHFGHIGIKKIHERSFGELYPDESEEKKQEKLVVWTNKE